MAEKLHRSCHGLTAAEGGLSLNELRFLVHLHQPQLPVANMPRKSLLRYLCHQLCPTFEYIGSYAPTESFITVSSADILNVR